MCVCVCVLKSLQLTSEYVFGFTITLQRFFLCVDGYSIHHAWIQILKCVAYFICGDLSDISWSETESIEVKVSIWGIPTSSDKVTATIQSQIWHTGWFCSGVTEREGKKFRCPLYHCTFVNYLICKNCLVLYFSVSLSLNPWVGLSDHQFVLMFKTELTSSRHDCNGLSLHWVIWHQTC